jgi:Tol biopolymer transport system component
MTTNCTTFRVPKTSSLHLVLVLFLTASCASRRVTPAPPLPTEAVPVHPGTIAFAVVGPGYVDDIYLIHTDGTGLTRLTETNTSAEAPAWSPDGSKIAYHMCPQGANDPHRQYDVWVMNSDGSKKQQLTHGSLGASYPAWSPDGIQIAYSTWFSTPEESRPAQIYVMNADGSNPRRVTNGSAYDLFPKWAPNGTILFLRKEHWDSHFGTLFAINPDGTGLAKVTTMERVGGFALSPDGSQIAIDNVGEQHIVLVPVNASNSPFTLVDTDFAYDFIQIAWSPDGKSLALAKSDFSGYEAFVLHIVNVDGSGLTTVPNANSVMDVAWRPK